MITTVARILWRQMTRRQTDASSPAAPPVSEQDAVLLQPFLQMPRGKGTRTMMVRTLGEAVGLSDEQVQSIVRFAEDMHAVSLLLDDIQDGSPMRRGVPSAHVTYGIPATLNAALLRLSRLLVEGRQQFGDTIAAIVEEELAKAFEGQGIDIALREGTLEPTMANYSKCVSGKTTIIFRAILRVVFEVCGLQPDKALLEDCEAFGLWFQMNDDFQNLVQDQGKGEGADDLREGKASWLKCTMSEASYTTMAALATHEQRKSYLVEEGLSAKLGEARTRITTEGTEFAALWAPLIAKAEGKRSTIESDATKPCELEGRWQSTESKTRAPSKMTALLALSRSHVVIANLTSVAAVTFIGGRIWTNVVLLMTALFANLSLQCMNQLVDEDGDRMNKPYMPIVRGVVSRGTVKSLAVCSMICAICIGVTQWGLFHKYMIYSGVIVALSGSYSLPPLRLKQYPVLGSLCILLSRPILFHWMLMDHAFVGASAGSTMRLANLYDVLVLMIIAVCLFKDACDVEGDKQTGVWTLPMIIGVRACAVAAAAFLTIASYIANVHWVVSALLAAHVLYTMVPAFVPVATNACARRAYLGIWRHFYIVIAACSVLDQPVEAAAVQDIASLAPFMMRVDEWVGSRAVVCGCAGFFAVWALLMLTVQQPPARHVRRSQGAITAIGLFILRMGLTESNVAFNDGSRPFVDTTSVQNAYDDWTNDGLLEYYWGDHIHLGYYPDGEANGVDFRQAKYDMTTQLFEWAHRAHNRVLPVREENCTLVDMGCGFGGSTRHLMKEYDIHNATGITLSNAQVMRARELTPAADPIRFKRIDATQTDFKNSSFDIVWSLEMEPHVLDKQRMVDEMLRVLKPGGLLVLGCWNVRDTSTKPLGPEEADLVRFLLEEWAHPNFFTIKEYTAAFQRHPDVESIQVDDWNRYTYPSWSESIWEGFRRPWAALVAGPRGWYGIVREMMGIERMRVGFRDGVMQYGVFAAVKRGGMEPRLPPQLATYNLPDNSSSTSISAEFVSDDTTNSSAC